MSETARQFLAMPTIWGQMRFRNCEPHSRGTQSVRRAESSTAS